MDALVRVPGDADDVEIAIAVEIGDSAAMLSPTRLPRWCKFDPLAALSRPVRMRPVGGIGWTGGRFLQTQPDGPLTAPVVGAGPKRAGER
jgi:hypothetical protein